MNMEFWDREDASYDSKGRAEELNWRYLYRSLNLFQYRNCFPEQVGSSSSPANSSAATRNLSPSGGGGGNPFKTSLKFPIVDDSESGNDYSSYAMKQECCASGSGQGGMNAFPMEHILHCYNSHYRKSDKKFGTNYTHFSFFNNASAGPLTEAELIASTASAAAYEQDKTLFDRKASCGRAIDGYGFYLAEDLRKIERENQVPGEINVMQDVFENRNDKAQGGCGYDVENETPWHALEPRDYDGAIRTYNNGSRMCVTGAVQKWEGVPHQQCHFPFIYRARIYTSCTRADSTDTWADSVGCWCSLKVDINGVHLTGLWGACEDSGECSDGCPFGFGHFFTL